MTIKREAVKFKFNSLEEDPFDIVGYIGERTIKEWNPVFGPWSAV